ncbi:hypothetical protein BKA69DRAFT_1178211 [Paraphysoderma sedebokerense]|nr:hypothetical protein BKA69DRAFT_1178211 [Paraphysoderma sedebokerense]
MARLSVNLFLIVASIFAMNSSIVYAQREYPICTTRRVTAVGTDGRRWGFENGESCIMPSSVRAGRPPVADTNDLLGDDDSSLPLCAGTVMTGRGRNGQLYGHENGNTCLIRP